MNKRIDFLPSSKHPVTRCGVDGASSGIYSWTSNKVSLKEQTINTSLREELCIHLGS